MPESGRGPLAPQEFAALADVSRETLERLSAYLVLLRTWHPRINLVSRTTLDDPWRRHFLDSAQLMPLVGNAADRIYDIGSGAGFPGLVLAIMGASDIHLIESDQRKATFLREVARITSTKITLHAERAEKIRSHDARLVISRACAALPRLLELSEPLLATAGVCLFLKGRDVEAELTAANKAWKMRTSKIPSKSDPTGVILRLEDLQHV